VEHKNSDTLDEVLNAAFERYGAAEPRPGLEGRILANLRAAGSASRRNRLWWPIAVACAAMFLIVATSLLVHIKRTAPSVARVIATPNFSPQIEPTPYAAAESKERIATGIRHVNASTKQPANHGVRQEQFPSPQPLSEQEKLLALYVEQFHREAILMARAQTELSQQEAIDPDAASGAPITQEQDQQQQNP
jgi:hypothetical protein